MELCGHMPRNLRSWSHGSFPGLCGVVNFRADAFRNLDPLPPASVGCGNEHELEGLGGCGDGTASDEDERGSFCVCM